MLAFIVSYEEKSRSVLYCNSQSVALLFSVHEIVAPAVVIFVASIFVGGKHDGMSSTLIV